MHGYKQSTIIPGYWTFTWQLLSFTLIVDDFGVKYTRKKDAEHLLSVLREHYAISADWIGKRYIRLTLDWDYKGKKVYLSMPGYIEDALVAFEHP